jgi:hypothetical protein
MAMRPLLLFFVFAISAGPLLSADELQIDPYEAPSHIGQNVSVSGVVVALFKSKRGNVFINFGGKYTNQTFTGWIPAGTPHRESSLAEDAPRQDGQDHWRDRALPREARDQNHTRSFRSSGMPRLLLPAFLFLCFSSAVQGEVVRGVLLNDDDSYIVKAARTATLYKAE